VTELSKPLLYSLSPDGDVMLLGIRCACGRVAYPRQLFGCEACGRTEEMQPVELAAEGVLAAAVQVHLHPGDMPKPPFFIGAVKIDSGPMVKAYLAAEGLEPGDRVKGVLAPVSDEAEAPLDLRFAAVSADPGGAHG
jgi:uncharacterized OB-fold protein